MLGRGFKCTLTKLPPGAIPAGVVEGDWLSARALLCEWGMSLDDADESLTCSFGWSGQHAYWRGKRHRAGVDEAELNHVASHLAATLGLTRAEIARVAASFPYVFGLSTDAIDCNLRRVTERYKMEGQDLVAAVMQRPEVLGVLVDCEGDCVGMCSRCFCQC